MMPLELEGNPLFADVVAPASLRERKKAKTRRALIEVSQRLFAEHGYSATTLEEISEQVEITTQTLLRYFDSKARLALAPMTVNLEALERFLDDPHRSLDTLTTWRQFVTLESLEASSPTSAATTSYVQNLRDLRKWVDTDPVLVAMASDVQRRLQEVLAASLARERDLALDDLHSTLVAALLVAGRLAVWNRWLKRDPRGTSLVEEQMAVIDYAVESLPASGARSL